MIIMHVSMLESVNALLKLHVYTYKEFDMSMQ